MYLIIPVYFFYFESQGYEVDGLDKIPSDGPALITMYHSATMLDIVLLQAKLFVEKRRLLRIIAFRGLKVLPGKFSYH